MPQTTTQPIEESILKILSGQSLGEISSELCDFSLADQNAATEAQGIQPSVGVDYVPTLGRTMTYIVACVVINDVDEILMMQEAKESCAGKWYLPAGRMETGETICEAAVREVFEETGLNVEMTTLLAVEAAGGCWMRFVLTGRITGGTLKTPAQADRESLQAKWIANIKDLSLRANDILNLIEIARAYKIRMTKKSSADMWHPEILPAKFSHRRNYLRVIAVIRKRATNSLNVLLSEKNVHHFPTVEIYPQRSIHSTLRKFMVELFGAELPQHRPHGLLSIEHNPSADRFYTTDGVCLTLLVAFRPPLEEVSLIGKCVWQELNKPLEEKISRMLSSKNATFPLNVIR